MISSRQFFYLIYCITGGISLFVVPRSILAHAGQFAWLAVALGLAIDLVLAMVLYYLGRRFPGRTMFEYSISLLGCVLGRLVGFTYTLFFFATAAFSLRVFAELLAMAVMPETPLLFFATSMAGVSAYTAWYGVQTIARLAELIGPASFLFTVFALVTVLPNVDTGLLSPEWPPAGLGGLLAGTLAAASWFGTCMVMGLLMAYHNQPGQALKTKAKGVATGAAVVGLVTVILVGVFGLKTVIRLTCPLYSLVQMVSLANFLEGVEALILVVWVGGGLITIASLYHAAAVGLAQVLGVGEPRYILLPLAALLVIASVSFFPYFSQLCAFTVNVLPFYAIILEIGPTALLFAVALVRRRRFP